MNPFGFGEPDYNDNKNNDVFDEEIKV